MTTAHEKVRMARALKDLPQIAGAFSTGELSYSKVRALTRVATALNEGPLPEYALSASAAWVEERCRELHQGSPDSLKEARSVYAMRGLGLSRLDERDKGCAFPGCSHTRYVDAHHVRHWSQGGQTNIDNLLLVCSAHRRLVHEGGYTIEKDYRGEYSSSTPMDARCLGSVTVWTMLLTSPPKTSLPLKTNH